MIRTFDVVVIGAGPSGEVLAGRLADRDVRVAIVEDRLVGGECSFWACMPSKALLRPAQALAEARRVPGAREAAAGELDPASALARRDEVIHGLDDAAQLPWLEERGVTLVRGRARIAGERRVRVEPGGEELAARIAVVLAAGTVPALPDVDGLAATGPWTNRQATTAPEIPGRLVVLGGGPVGCELAQAYATLGSRVTLVETAPRLLGREEPFASDAVRRGLEDAGVDVRTGATPRRAERAADGSPAVALEGGETLPADVVLAAGGRRVESGDLGLDRVLGEVEPGAPIEVDGDFRAGGLDWLRVVGDANGIAQLTHAGKAQARRLADLLTGRDPGPAAPQVTGPRSPRVTFTEPQVAAVGHTEAGARDAGLRVRIADADAGATAGASFHGRGVPAPCRLVVDADREVVVGATFTGPDVAELLHAATVAIAAEVPLRVLRQAVPAFPTRSEVWLALLDDA